MRGVLELIYQSWQRSRTENFVEIGSIRRNLSPFSGHLRRYLQMELHPVGAPPPLECLDLVKLRARKQHGARGKLNSVVVPVESHQLAWESRENMVVACGFSEVNGQEADFRNGTFEDRRSEAGREELTAQAHPPIR